MMRRREFITLLSGAAVAWPLAARAQQADRMRRIGVLMHLAADDPEGQRRVAAFLQGLQEAGWAVRRNMDIDMRWAAREADRYRRYAMEIVALTPDVIVTSAPPSIRAMQQATRTVPIVFVLVPDAVGTGIVDSLSRPGGNTTDGTFVGCQGDHHPVTVREMRRTPRGGRWYAKSVSDLLARACVI